MSDLTPTNLQIAIAAAKAEWSYWKQKFAKYLAKQEEIKNMSVIEFTKYIQKKKT